jgi:hypothetical protein
MKPVLPKKPGKKHVFNMPAGLLSPAIKMYLNLGTTKLKLGASYTKLEELESYSHQPNIVKIACFCLFSWSQT